MRNPKCGDRCEYAVFNHKTMRKERTCETRHLQGTPPGLLMPVKQGRETVLMCNRHAQEMYGGITSLSTQAVKRQKKGRANAVQESLI